MVVNRYVSRQFPVYILLTFIVIFLQTHCVFFAKGYLFSKQKNVCICWCVYCLWVWQTAREYVFVVCLKKRIFLNRLIQIEGQKEIFLVKRLKKNSQKSFEKYILCKCVLLLRCKINHSSKIMRFMLDEIV